MDEITVCAEAKNFSDPKTRSDLLQRLTKELYETIRIRVNVELIEEDGISRQEGKAKRLIDERKEK